MPMKLYWSPASPYVRKVMITAHEAGLAERIERIAVSGAPNAPSRDIAPHNPLMKMPTLLRDDGSALYDSIVICEYLDALGGARMFPRDGEARWQALRRHALADGMLDAALAVRYETVMRPEPLRWQDWIDGHGLKIDGALDAFEHEATGFGDAFDIGHASLAVALGYLDFRFAARPWRPGRPRLDAWFARVCARASVRLTTPQ